LERYALLRCAARHLFATPVQPACSGTLSLLLFSPWDGARQGQMGPLCVVTAARVLQSGFAKWLRFSAALFDGDGDFQDVSSFCTSTRTPFDGTDQYEYD